MTFLIILGIILLIYMLGYDFFEHVIMWLVMAIFFFFIIAGIITALVVFFA